MDKPLGRLTVRKRKTLFAGSVGRMDPGRLPKYLWLGEPPQDKRNPKGREKERMRFLGEDTKALGIKDEGGTTVAQKPGEWHASVEMG